MAINLLPQNLQEEQKHRNYKLISVSLSLVMLIALVAATAGIFAYRLVVSKQYATLQQDVDDFISQINQKQSEEWYLKVVKAKSETARGFLSERLPYYTVLLALQKHDTEGVELGDVSMEGESSVVVEGRVTSPADLAAFLNSLTTEEGIFETVRVTDLRFSDVDYSYGFALQAILDEDAIAVREGEL